MNGLWHTSFSVMGSNIRLDMLIENPYNQPSIKMKDPDNKDSEYTLMEEISITDSTLSFTWKSIGLSFDGTYHQHGDSITGVFTQMDIKWDAAFTREERKLPVLNRPQEPKAPFPYSEKELSIKNGAINLGATMTIPDNFNSETPIVILASGTGPQDRNCEILGHKPFWIIADRLSRNGIAVVRFDDRGVGKSSGNYAQATLQDFGSDVDAIAKYISSLPEYKNHTIGLAGHSEGGMHILIAANKNKNIEFIIELASVGTSGKQVLVEQQYLIPLNSGGDEKTANWNSTVFEGLSDIIIKYPKTENAVEPISKFLDSMYQIAPEDYKAMSNPMNFKMGLLMFMNNEWAREFVKFETKDYLKKLKIPVLAINAERDIQVPGERNKKAFEENFSSKSRPNSKTYLLQGANHLFQQCKTCSVLEYSELEESFSEEAMNIMIQWIKELP